MRIEGAPLDSGPPREIAFDSESESTTRGRLGIARRRCRVSQRVGVWKPLGIGVERKVGRGREEDQDKEGVLLRALQRSTAPVAALQGRTETPVLRRARRRPA